MKEVNPSGWPSQVKETTVEKTAARDWFIELRNRLCSVFEKIEEELKDGPNAHSPPGKFKRKTWQREGGGLSGSRSTATFQTAGLRRIQTIPTRESIPREPWPPAYRRSIGCLDMHC